jgi:hypothetical protein
LKNLNVEEELFRAIEPIIGRRKLLRTTRRVIVRYAIEWAVAPPRTTDIRIIRSVAGQVWPTLALTHSEARVKTITIQYRDLIRPLNAVLGRLVAEERTARRMLRVASSTAQQCGQRTLADFRYRACRTSPSAT